MNEAEIQKLIQENLDWLFYHFELDKADIFKSVNEEDCWNFTVKLKMGRPRPLFKDEWDELIQASKIEGIDWLIDKIDNQFRVSPKQREGGEHK